jgi:hypothetical protein
LEACRENRENHEDGEQRFHCKGFSGSFPTKAT